MDLAILELRHLGKVSHQKKKRKKDDVLFVCLRVIQKPLLISSLVIGSVFRKASAFDVFEALCETSKTIWSNRK